MLVTAVLCFIDQRIASFLYRHFKDKLHIHKRFFSKFFCTTFVVMCQILFDKDCSLINKSQSVVDQTELTNIESTQPQSPSFNLRTYQKSTPNRTFLPTPAPRTFKTTQSHPNTTDIVVHHDDTENTFYTAHNSQLNS
jgi:hypothetical protein